MSEENVELARRLLDAWNRRDIDVILALSDSEGEFVNSPTAVEPGTRRGHDEIATVLKAQWEQLDARQEIDRIFDRGDEIVVLGRLSRRMPESNARLEDRVLTFMEVPRWEIDPVADPRFRQHRSSRGSESSRPGGVAHRSPIRRPGVALGPANSVSLPRRFNNPLLRFAQSNSESWPD